MKAKKLFCALTAATSLGLLSACGGSSNGGNDSSVDPVTTPDPVSSSDTFAYEVKVKNLTNDQPLSPLAVLLHNEGKLFEIGQPASVALEDLAEGGSPAQVVALNFALDSASGETPIFSGDSATVTVEYDEQPTFLSAATMLINTNDAFTGLNAIDISALAVNEQLTFDARTYDAGTEANTESAGTIPGPANSGEGFNAARDDIRDQVTMHPGVVTRDDGLATSVLTQAHKFDAPSARFIITRVE